PGGRPGRPAVALGGHGARPAGSDGLRAAGGAERRGRRPGEPAAGPRPALPGAAAGPGRAGRRRHRTAARPAAARLAGRAGAPARPVHARRTAHHAGGRGPVPRTPRRGARDVRRAHRVQGADPLVTAESTVPTPAGQPREAGYPAVSVMPPRGSSAGFRFPVRRPPARPRSPAPRPRRPADGAAPRRGALALTGDRRGPLLVAVLVAASLLLRPRRAGRATGVLDELPAVCGRIAVVWLALAALVAAYAPQQALA